MRQEAIKLINNRGAVNVSMVDLCDAVGVPVGSFNAHAGMTFVEFMRGLVREGHVGPTVRVNKKRTDPIILRAHLVAAALILAEGNGYKQVQRSELADRMGVNRAAVYSIFPTDLHLRRSIMSAAVKRGSLPVIAQGLADRNTIARKAPATVRDAATAWARGA